MTNENTAQKIERKFTKTDRYVILILRPCPPRCLGEGVSVMEIVFAFITSVAANVASYYICKWLDGRFTGRKH